MTSFMEFTSRARACVWEIENVGGLTEQERYVSMHQETGIVLRRGVYDFCGLWVKTPGMGERHLTLNVWCVAQLLKQHPEFGNTFSQYRVESTKEKKLPKLSNIFTKLNNCDQRILSQYRVDWYNVQKLPKFAAYFHQINHGDPRIIQMHTHLAPIYMYAYH